MKHLRFHELPEKKRKILEAEAKRQETLPKPYMYIRPGHIVGNGDKGD